MADNADTFPAETTEAAYDCWVVAKFAVAGERNEIPDQPGNIVQTMGSLRMPGDLGLLPRREFSIELLQRSRRFGFQPTDFFANGDCVARLAHGTQFFDFGLEFGHGLFKIEVTAHRVRAKGRFRSEMTRARPFSQATG